ncbi:MAG: PAS domain S-box protein [Chloroflexota bacterium]
MTNKLADDGTINYCLADNQEISAQTLNELLENTFDAAYKRNLKTDTYDYFSPVITRLTGYTPQEMKNMPAAQALSLMHPDDQPGVKRAMALALQGENGVPCQVQYRFRHRDGDYRWLEDRFTILRGEDGQPAALVGNVGDICARRQVEDELIQANTRMAGVLEGIHAATWEWNVQTGEIVINELWAEMIGYSKAELLPSTIKTWEKFTHPDDVALVYSQLEKNFSGGKPFYDCEIRMLHRDGHWVWVNDIGRVITRTEDGKPLKMFGTHTDISQRKQTEMALQESLNRYKMLFENMSEGFSLQEIITDPDGKAVDFRFLEANNAFEAHTGLKSEEVIGRTMLEVVPSADKKQIEAYGVVALTGRPMEYEYFSETFKKYLKVRAFCPQIGRFATTYEDITTRRLAEIEKHNHQQRLQLLVDTSQDAILMLNSSGKIEEANPAASRIFGWTAAELIGMEENRLLDTESAEVIRAREEIAATGKFNGVLPFFRKDSAHFPGELFSVLYTETGEKRSSLIIRDITERLRIDEAQRAAESIYHNMFDSNTAAKLLIDPETGAIVRANQGAAEFYGWPVQTLEQMHLQEINVQTPEEIRDNLRNMLAQHRQYHIFKNRIENGEIRDVEVYSSPLDYNGRKLVFSIIHDVTDRKITEDALLELQADLENRVIERTEDLQIANIALEKALKVKDEFLSTMSHEFRTPLTGVIGLTQSLLLNNANNFDEKTTRSLQMIEKSGQHLSQMISTILEYTRLQSGKTVLQLQPCLLSNLVRSQLLVSSRLAFEKNIPLSLGNMPEDVLVLLDEKRINQVLQILLSNAVKFTDPGGKVVVSVLTDRLAKKISISVADTGIGIKASDKQRLFQPFVQLDSALARQYEGIGMGLVMVKLLVELHQGKVEVFSEPGSGSTFTVILPWRER